MFMWSALEWRLIGPFRGGRVVAVAGDWRTPRVFYFGSTGGGVWKTTDGGQYWDERLGRLLQARLGRRARRRAVRPERDLRRHGRDRRIRGNVSHGDGVYKSTDGGRDLAALGLAETRNIGKVRVHPHESRPRLRRRARPRARPEPGARRLPLAATAAQTWEHVLYRSEDAGAIDLAHRPAQPAHHLRRASGRRGRGPHYLTSGGAGQRPLQVDRRRRHLDRAHATSQGCRRASWARSASPPRRAQPGRVWAHRRGRGRRRLPLGRRRRDLGARSTRIANLRQRAWYYTHIYRRPAATPRPSGC